MPPDEPRRSAWSPHMWDMWSDDDPGVRLGREGLALQPVQEPVQAEEPTELAPTAIPEPGPAPEAFSRRERVAQLVRRVQAGDLSAVAALRELVGG